MINYLEDMLTNKVFSKQNLSKKFIFKFQDGALFEETGKGIPWLRINYFNGHFCKITIR